MEWGERHSYRTGNSASSLSLQSICSDWFSQNQVYLKQNLQTQWPFGLRSGYGFVSKYQGGFLYSDSLDKRLNQFIDHFLILDSNGVFDTSISDKEIARWYQMFGFEEEKTIKPSC